MKSGSKRNILIGLTVLVSIFLLYWGINYLKGVNLFKPTNYYYAKFDKINGLAISSPVNVNGFQVGQIKEISYDYAHNKIVVEMSLDKHMQVPQGSTVSMVTSILGTAELQINLGTSKPYYKVGDTIPTKIHSGLMDEVGNNLMPQVAQMMPKIDSILTNVNTVMAAPSIKNSLTRLDAITIELEKSSRELTLLMTQLNRSVPSLVSHADGAMSHAGDLVSGLQRTSENLEDLSFSLKNLPLDSTVNRINSTLANIQQLTKQLNRKDSTLGMLMNDKQLYANASGAVTSLDSLLRDIKKNPKRYVTIKIF